MADLDPFVLFIGLTVGMFIGAVIVLLAVTLRKPLLAVTPAPPEAVLRDLAFRLRAWGRLVKESSTHLEVDVNSLSRLKIHVRGTPRGTEVRYEVDATGTGWTIVLILAGFSGVGIISIAIALYIHFSASGFARDFVAPLLSAAPLGTPPPPTVRSLLVEGLSEAQRLAKEAAEYEQEAMHNNAGVVLIGALALFVVVLVALFPITGLSFLPFAVAGGASVALGVLGPWFIVARARPRVREFEAEAALLGAAVATEALGYPMPGAPRPGLELLLRAAERSSIWREVRRRRKLWHDPIAGFVVFLLGYGAFLFLLFAAVIDIAPLPVRLALGVLGAVFAIGAAVSVRRWRRQVRDEDERDRRAWESRKGALETELWKILSG